MLHRTARLLVLLLLAGLSTGACKKVIGDKCTAATDCSATADRQCDLSQPSGYCTIENCDPNGCPDNAVCIGFDAYAPRIERRFCMAGCDQDSDCRTPDYHCVLPDGRACLVQSADGGAIPVIESCNVLIDSVPRSVGFCAPSVP